MTDIYGAGISRRFFNGGKFEKQYFFEIYHLVSDHHIRQLYGVDRYYQFHDGAVCRQSEKERSDQYVTAVI